MTFFTIAETLISRIISFEVQMFANLPFSPNWYLSQNPDVAAATDHDPHAAYLHFANYGRYEGRTGSALFNAQEYLHKNPDVAAAVDEGLTTAWDHFQQFGATEGRNFSNIFDENFYLRQNPDVARAIEVGDLPSATLHFLTFGQWEPRAINSVIDIGEYLSANSDVQAAVQQGLNPLLHLLEHGVREGRELGNGISLAQFAADPIFTQALANGNIEAALTRVESVAPFIPTFVRPENWVPRPDLPIPTNFVAPDDLDLDLVVPPDIEIPADTTLPAFIVPANDHPDMDTTPPLAPVPQPGLTDPEVAPSPKPSFKGRLENNIWRFDGYNEHNGPISLASKPSGDTLYYAHGGQISNVPLHAWEWHSPSQPITRLLIGEGQTLALTLEEAAMHTYNGYYGAERWPELYASGLITREPGDVNGPAGEIIIGGPLTINSTVYLLGIPRDDTVKISGEERVITLKKGQDSSDSGGFISFSTLADGLHIEGDNSTWVNLLPVKSTSPVSYSTNSRGAMGGTWGDDTLTNTGATEIVIYGSRGGDTIVLGESSKSVITLSMGQSKPWVEQSFVVTAAADTEGGGEHHHMSFVEGSSYTVTLPGELGTVESGVLKKDLQLPHEVAELLNANNTVPGVYFTYWSTADNDLVLGVLFDGENTGVATLTRNGDTPQTIFASNSDVTRPAHSVSDSTFSNFDTVKGFKLGVDSIAWIMGKTLFKFKELVNLKTHTTRADFIEALDCLNVGEVGIGYVTDEAEAGAYLFLDNGNGDVDPDLDALIYLPDMETDAMAEVTLASLGLGNNPLRIELPLDVFV